MKQEVNMSLLETLVEVTFEVASILQDERHEHYEALNGFMGKNGFMAVNALCIDISLEFEQVNEGREWDGEWLEELQSFTIQKINAL